MDNGKQNRIPLGANPNKTAKIPREQWINHPEFMPMFQAAMVGVEFPKDKIPSGFKIWLDLSLRQIPFSLLKMPIEGYKELIDNESDFYSFGLLQKAIDIVYNSKPVYFGADTDLMEYYLIIEDIIEMKQIIAEIQEPIKQDIIDKLILKEAPSILK